MGRPVSEALVVPPKDTITAPVTEALKAIDAVHSDGELPVIPVVAVDKGPIGQYWVARDEALRIELRRDAEDLALHATHEVGHFLDHQTLHASGIDASVSKAAGKEIVAALKRTKAATTFGRTAKAKYFFTGEGKFRRQIAVTPVLKGEGRSRPGAQSSHPALAPPRAGWHATRCRVATVTPRPPRCSQSGKPVEDGS
jgi:hypothetical protein